MNLCISCNCWYSLCYSIYFLWLLVQSVLLYIFLVTVGTVCVTLFTYSAPVQLDKAAEPIFEVQHTLRADSLLPRTNRLFTGKWRAKGAWRLTWFLNHRARKEVGLCILCTAEIRYFVEIQGSVCKQKNQPTYLTRAPTQNCFNNDQVSNYNTTRYPGNTEKQRNRRSEHWKRKSKWKYKNLD